MFHFCNLRPLLIDYVCAKACKVATSCEGGSREDLLPYKRGKPDSPRCLYIWQNSGWPLVGNEGMNPHLTMYSFIPSFFTKGHPEFG